MAMANRFCCSVTPTTRHLPHLMRSFARCVARPDNAFNLSKLGKSRWYSALSLKTLKPTSKYNV